MALCKNLSTFLPLPSIWFTNGLQLGLRAFVEQRRDLPKLDRAVRDSQRRRRVVDHALTQGVPRPWDFQPFRDAARSYVRNTIPLDDLEAMARFPKAGQEGRTGILHRGSARVVSRRKQARMELTAILTPANEGGYCALNPETGTVSQGETVELAVANLREAVELCLEEFPLGHTVRSASAFVTTFEVADGPEALAQNSEPGMKFITPCACRPACL